MLGRYLILLPISVLVSEDKLEAKNLRCRGFESFYNERTSGPGYLEKIQRPGGFHERTDKEPTGF